MPKIQEKSQLLNDLKDVNKVTNCHQKLTFGCWVKKATYGN